MTKKNTGDTEAKMFPVRALLSETPAPKKDAVPLKNEIHTHKAVSSIHACSAPTSKP